MKAIKGLIFFAKNSSLNLEGEELIDNFLYKEVDLKEKKGERYLGIDCYKYAGWVEDLEYVELKKYKENDFKSLNIKPGTGSEPLLLIDSKGLPYYLSMINSFYNDPFNFDSYVLAINTEVFQELFSVLRHDLEIFELEEKQEEKYEKAQEKVKKQRVKIMTMRKRKSQIREKILSELQIKSLKEIKDIEERKSVSLKIETEMEQIEEKIQKEVKKLNSLIKKAEQEQGELRKIKASSKFNIVEFSSAYWNYKKLIRAEEIIAVNEEENFFIFKKGKQAKYSSLTKKEMFEFLKKVEEAKKSDQEIMSILKEHYEKIPELDISFAVPTYNISQGEPKHTFNLLKYEEPAEIDTDSIKSSSELEILAPVKSSIAAAMLASGSISAKNAKELEIEGEPTLVKVSITPVVKKDIVESEFESKTVVINTWEPRMGLYKKLSKELTIYSQ